MSTERALLRGALFPTSIVGAIAIAIATWLKGGAGFGGALLAQVIVIIFFAANLAVARISRDLDPVMTMSLAMVSYMAKIVLLGIFLWLITTFIPESLCDRTSFGLAAVGAGLAWLGGEIAAFLRLRLHLQLPPKG
jgi:fructose-specific phosphotransferase system IIC component